MTLSKASFDRARGVEPQGGKPEGLAEPLAPDPAPVAAAPAPAPAGAAEGKDGSESESELVE